MANLGAVKVEINILNVPEVRRWLDAAIAEIDRFLADVEPDLVDARRHLSGVQSALMRLRELADQCADPDKDSAD